MSALGSVLGEVRRFERGFRTAALDLLYPPGCVACDEPLSDGPTFCELCSATLVELEAPCPRCALPRGDGRAACASCRLGPTSLDEVHAAYAFGGALADALRLLKFSARTDLGERLGVSLAPALSSLLTRFPSPLVVPVPLSRERLAQRGYNQAALLALGACAGAHLRLKVRVDVLHRVRDTATQTGKSAAARRHALTGAFRATAEVRDRVVVLVDDVMTTGATLAACAGAARAAGATRVLALTVGRALP